LPGMHREIGYIALIVRDYDEAVAYFVEKLDFLCIEDTELSAGKRWVMVSLPVSRYGTSRRLVGIMD